MIHSAYSDVSDIKFFHFNSSQESPMRIPAEQFLAIRAFGAPPIVVALAAQGTFRGLKDLKTPLFAICKFHNTTFFENNKIVVLVVSDF